MSIIDDETRSRQTALIDAWVLDLRVHGKSEATIESYEGAARRAHAALLYGLPGSTTDELTAWLWGTDHKPATRKLYRAAVVNFCAWATTSGHIDYNAASLLPTVRVPAGRSRPAPQDVLEDLLARGRGPYPLWFLLAAGMGLRCVEISRLDREHVEAERTWVQGKGGKNTDLPTHPAVWDAVKQLPTGPIARRADGTRATRRDVYQRGNRHIHRLGHPGVTMHMLRHWHGNKVYRASGRDLLVAKEALRHSDVSMTQRYVLTDDVDLIAAQRAIPLPI